MPKRPITIHIEEDELFTKEIKEAIEGVAKTHLKSIIESITVAEIDKKVQYTIDQWVRVNYRNTSDIANLIDTKIDRVIEKDLAEYKLDEKGYLRKVNEKINSSEDYIKKAINEFVVKNAEFQKELDISVEHYIEQYVTKALIRALTKPPIKQKQSNPSKSKT